MTKDYYELYIAEQEKRKQVQTENERLAKTIKQYEEAIPALVKENEELRAQVQERTNFETAIKEDNERMRANA